ncbi:MAG: heme-copper oxidase subunit III [Deltaproteobacteria bacterium]|nr:heme-copper oxidase subunit III [Deltaproteobacteria bacterium]
MSIRGDAPLGPVDGSRRPAPVSNGVLAMLIFVIAETMLFAGFISAFTIIRSSAMQWPPPDQPRLPVEATAVTTLALLASGVLLLMAHRAFHGGNRARTRTPLMAAFGLGAFFVLFQGFEWVRLIAQGLTLTSSNLGSFFYLIVGIHALHAIGALGLLAYACVRLQRGWLTASVFGAAEVFWLFVVGIWPVLYGVVYW